MQNYIYQALDWLRERWFKLNVFWRVVYGALGAVAVYFLITFIPTIRWLKEWYGSASADAQLMFLIVSLLFLLGFMLFGFDEWHRVKQLTTDKAKAEEGRERAEEKARLAEDEAKRLQARWDHLLDVACRDVLWKRPCLIAAPAFVPKLNRRTRFLTVLNLKGGVGKTTLTANLAACLATGTPPLKVLLIDIDFQGTLGGATVENALIRVQHQTGNIVNELLTTATPGGDTPARLAVPMNEVEGVRVILARDTLDAAEFQLQARFLLDTGDDPRFRFRSHLHRPDVFEQYDVVIFDCPPRVTTSVVNAVACSDYILIPTKLDDGSIEAVPRTVSWLKSLSATCQAEIVGVVASHTTVLSGKLIKADQKSYDRLGQVVQSECGDGLLFAAHVEEKKAALGSGPGSVAGVSAKGRVWFAGVAQELRKRMKL